MIKKQLFISFLVVLLITAVSCNSNRKIYYSDGGVAKVNNDSTGKVHHRLGKKGNPDRKERGLGLSFGKYSKLTKNGTLDQKYEAAIKYFDAEDYTKALGLFEELMAVYRGTARGEEVHYYYAYCNYNLEDYLVAGYQFRNYVKVFPSGKHAEECAYMNAYCFYLNSPEYSLDQIDTKLAIKEFQSFVTRYPKSERIPKCNELIDQLRGKLERKSYENAMLYYNMADYKAAVTSFGNHIKDFPGTEHAEQLSYLTIRAWYSLALISIEAKKQERYKAAMDSYTKFVESYPKSIYLKDAEFVYSSAQKALEKYNKSSS
ncbi:MAG: hypothetical protein JWP12_1241 [Bacteroidetes bacterium]|nr:hypothetical protein [Bacteroidota bacterium]